MHEVTVQIGGRPFEVACQEGEEHYLTAAAALLDAEAQTIMGQIGRLPEARMLLMAGLMLSDKFAGHADQVGGLERRLAEQEAELEQLRNAPAPEPDKIEVAVVPESVTDTLAELAARAEALADAVEEAGSAG